MGSGTGKTQGVSIRPSGDAGPEGRVGSADLVAGSLSRKMSLRRGSWTGQGVEFGEYEGGVCRAYSFEYLVCLAQQGFGLSELAGGDGTPGQAGECGGFIPGASDEAG